MDIVGGGNLNQYGGSGLTMNRGAGGGIKLVEEIIVDILKILEPATNTIGGGEIIIKARPSVSLVAGGFAVAGEFVSFPAFLFERRPERREGSLGF